ncbi:Uncharacterised protein [Bordetella pertussis]|nr:Uncharacterised protein [Bordetella pertussis]CFW32391.1 Uncharacterised protein [Bordetella pertussis]
MTSIQPGWPLAWSMAASSSTRSRAPSSSVARRMMAGSP